MGHGVLFLDARPGAGDFDVLAVVRGFEWLRNAEFVYAEILLPGAGHDADFMGQARRTIEDYIRDPGPLGVMPRLIAPTIRLVSNC